MRFLVLWAIVAAALWVAASVVPGVTVTTGPALLIAAFVLGLVNALVRPILTILTLPITILTLGLFYLVVNAAAFGLAAAVVPGFSVAGFGSAVIGALLVSLVSWVLGALFKPER